MKRMRGRAARRASAGIFPAGASVIDDRIVERAERKLRRYGTDLSSYLTAVLVTIVAAPSLPSVSFPPAPRPTDNVRKCIKAAKDIESGKIAAKGYTDMDEMMKDLLR